MPLSTYYPPTNSAGQQTVGNGFSGQQQPFGQGTTSYGTTTGQPLGTSRPTMSGTGTGMGSLNTIWFKIKNAFRRCIPSRFRGRTLA